MVRADARQNRSRILSVAREAFTEDGGTSMNHVAQRAGVGAGTLYRHFPTREALLLAVYADEVDRIVDRVPALLNRLPPREALRLWTGELVDAMRKKHGLGGALSPEAHDTMAQQSHAPIVAAIATMLDAGKQDGSIRRDAEPGDYLQLTGALWRASTDPEDRAPHMLELILDGLRPA